MSYFTFPSRRSEGSCLSSSSVFVFVFVLFCFVLFCLGGGGDGGRLGGSLYVVSSTILQMVPMGLTSG